MDDVWTDYVRLLSDLRRGPGCTLQRLGEKKYVSIVEALRVRLSSSGKSTRLEDCREELRSMGRILDERKVREAFLVGFRLDDRYEADTVRERRQAYLGDLERSVDSEAKKLRADVRTLERRENKAIQTIARWLSEGYTQSKDLLVRAPSFDRELHVVRRSCVYFYTSGGAVREVNNFVWVRALVPNADPQLPSLFKIGDEKRRGVLDIRPRYGCNIVAQRESDTGTIETVFEILTRLSPEDGEYGFAWDAIVHSTGRAASHVRWKLRPPFTPHIEFHLNFHEDCVPIRAWWFITSDDERAQFEPDEAEGKHLPLLDDGRYVYRVFTNEDYSQSPFVGIGYAWE